MERRKVLEFVTASPNDEKIVSMVEFQGTIIVATEKNVYHLIDSSLEKIEMHPSCIYNEQWIQNKI